ncbi:Retrovirus-related Pol polyprotein from transposon TNT 1-94 [Vitis vinifera]|uniref:Retrovirus-related Pol polyprotein from transposon TNT 1-94 n=1 Tax=Vitis vinifera TaxID=29760 RepID=A0A438F179_VITVI|nr:Retrovirus-related Pol polyprotein from transposon TNT 1-94 [Vitis vinifera]
MSEVDPPPLGANPTVAQMKAYEEKKLKKDKAITCLHSGLAYQIFTKIMDLETPKQVWDKLQGEFEGSNIVKIVKLLTLKREFELMKMKNNESVKDYSSKLMDVVNQMRLLATCDLQSLTIAELTSKLHAKEQRVLMRGDEATEGAFQENHKGKSSRNLQGKKFFKNNKGKAEGSSRKENFSPCYHCSRTNHAEKDCWYKVQPKVKLGNGEVVQAKEKGIIAINTKRGHVFCAKIDESIVWHIRYGHFNLKSLKFMQKVGIVEDMPEITINAQTCESCELRKQHHKSFPQNMSKRATHKLELVHSDICGPMSIASLSNNVYFALFIDDLSRMTWVYFLKAKSQVLSMFKSFKKMVETQSGQKVKVLRTDNGGEYTSKEFNVFCQEARIAHQLTTPYSSQQNGVYERNNITVMEMARCMLFEKNLPKLLWAEAVSTSVYLLNRLPTKSVKSKTPIEAWPGVIPSVKHLKVFSSSCYLHVPSIKRGKLDERAKKGVLVWDLKKVHKCDQTTPSILEPAIESTSLEDPLDVEATSDTPMLKVRPLSDVYERCNLIYAEPTCYTEVARFPKWIEAMKPEINVIERNGTWKLTELPKATKAIGVKWVFRTKFNSDGSTFKHKARLVVKGFAQVVGVDYGDTFAPIARHDTIRLLLALAGQIGWKVYHLDVKSAFLNGIFLEDIYVQQPEGFENEDGLQLVVSLYVDDMLVTGSNVRLLVEFKMEMQDVFEMSDLGIMNYFLGMEIYQCSLGSLLYLIATRPDLMFPAGLLSRFMSSPSNVDMGVAKSVLKYVRSTTNLGIWYLKTGGVKLDGYANIDWAGSVDDMKSTLELYCDNKSAIAIAQNPVQHGKTKHMNVKFHYIREAEKNSLVKLHYCSTDMQLVDIMTKALPKSRLEFLKLKLAMSKANLKEEF